MDTIRLHGLCFCLWPFLAFSATGAENDLRAEASASIQATATVISPVGLTETRSTPDDGWLLYAPNPEGVLIQVSQGGHVIEEFSPLDDHVPCAEPTLLQSPHISFVSCTHLAGAVPNDTLALVVTVVYPDN